MSRIGEFSEGNRFVHAHNIDVKPDRPHLSEKITGTWHKLQHIGHVALHPEAIDIPVAQTALPVPQEALPPQPAIFEQAA